MEFPSLFTARLHLRQPSLNDTAAYHEILSMPEVTRYSNMTDGPSEERSRMFVKWMANLHRREKGCAWIVALREGEKPIGAIRIDELHRNSCYGVIGYELHPDYWGSGLMSEALSAIVVFAHETLELNRLEAWTLAGNPASDRVLEKNGFRYEGTQRQKKRFKGQFHDLRIFGRLACDGYTVTDNAHAEDEAASMPKPG